MCVYCCEQYHQHFVEEVLMKHLLCTNSLLLIETCYPAGCIRVWLGVKGLWLNVLSMFCPT